MRIIKQRVTEDGANLIKSIDRFFKNQEKDIQKSFHKHTSEICRKEKVSLEKVFSVCFFIIIFVCFFCILIMGTTCQTCLKLKPTTVNTMSALRKKYEILYLNLLDVVEQQQA